MYDPRLVEPMRAELTQIGFTELKTPSEVDEALGAGSAGSAQELALVVVNSVCGCAAGGARPGVGLALQRATKKPARLFTVFAGQDREATERARQHFVGHPPSSPSMALIKGGEVVCMLERRDIEGFSAEQIAQKLITAFDTYC